MYILGITEDVVDAARSLAVTLCKVIYGLICFFFDIFNSLGKIRLDVDVSGIFQRIGFILGLFMIFRLTFAAIEYLINPDTMLDKQKGIGNIIKKVLIVVILLGSTSYLFKEAYRLQDRLIDNRVIEKILLPGFTFAYDSDDGSASDGTKIAWYTFSQFYNIEGTSKTCDSNTNDLIKNTFFKNHSLAAAYTCVNERSNKEYIVNFDGLIAILCGGLLLWILATYTIQAGIRVVQLAYLEMIAPIPIMMYLMPKGEDKLKKWGQQCLTTFLDFFMRLAILDLVILLSSAVISSNNIFPQDLDGSWNEGWLKVVLLLATFTFAKRVPELIKEIFPSMGSKASLDFGLKTPKQAWSGLKSTPVLGLGASAIGYGVNKGYKAYKTKHDEMKNVRKKARLDLQQNKELYDGGKKLHNKYGNDGLPDTAFSSSEYRASYNEVLAAKNTAKSTERALDDANREYTAAYNSSGPGREERLAAARTNFENAQKKDKAAQTKLEIAKQHHENMKKMHTKDAKIEDAYKYYGDLNPVMKETPPAQSTASGHQTSQQQPSQMSVAEADRLFREVGVENMNEEQQIQAYEAYDRASKETKAAARIVNDPNASDEEQIKAAAALDRAARERNNNNNNNK